MAPKQSIPHIESLHLDATALENPVHRAQAKAAVMAQPAVVLSKVAKALEVSPADVSLEPPHYAHAPRGKVGRLGGKTFAAWKCQECEKRIIYLTKDAQGNPQLAAYVRVPDCALSQLSKKQWLMNDEKTQRRTKGQVATPPYPWHRSRVQYDEISLRYGGTTAEPPAQPASAAATAAPAPQHHAAPTPTERASVPTQEAAQAGVRTVQHFLQTGVPV